MLVAILVLTHLGAFVGGYLARKWGATEIARIDAAVAKAKTEL